MIIWISKLTKDSHERNVIGGIIPKEHVNRSKEWTTLVTITFHCRHHFEPKIKWNKVPKQ